MAAFKRIDHVAIAVKDANAATKRYVELLGARHIRTEILQEKAGPAKVSYMQLGENIITLIQSMDPDGFVNKHIEKHGEGLHHMGLEVDNLDEFIAETTAKGFRIPLKDEFSNRKEVVLSPRDTAGATLQILEWKSGSDKTVEDRIQRILSLENIPKD